MKYSEAIAYWQKAIDHARQSTDSNADLKLSNALHGLGNSHVLAGYLAQGIDSYKQWIEVLKRIWDGYPAGRRDLCMSFYWLGKFQSEAGHQEVAAAFWRSVLEQCEAVGRGLGRWFAVRQ